jgi:hypothetical protein
MIAPTVTEAMDAALLAGGEMTMNLPEPPCADCIHWKPAVRRDHTGGVHGVRLCWSSSMEFDFSCFQQVKKVEAPRPRAEPHRPESHRPESHRPDRK